MFKTKVVNSRNIRKTTAYKAFQFALIPVLLFFVAMSFGLLGHDSAIETFFHENQSSIIRPIAIIIIILGVGLSLMMKTRLKNPQMLGDLEIDEKGFRFLTNEKVDFSGSWSDTRFVKLEFFSSANINNPQGCLNYLTIIGNQGVRTFEIIIENSLIKADLGELLRKINSKIPVKVSYSIPLKKIFGDNDLKL
jgi:hypothetical protein